MIKTKLSYETRIINSHPVRFYNDSCPTCGILKIRRSNKLGKECSKCRMKDHNKLLTEKLIYLRDVPQERKNIIRKKTRNAVRSGRIKKLPCQVCGNITSEAHHINYNEWFNPMWLCRKHHAEQHHVKLS